MKHLFFALVLLLSSLSVFYIAAALITAKSSISEMPENIRHIIFGIWLFCYVTVMMFYAMDKSTDVTKK